MSKIDKSELKANLQVLKDVLGDVNECSVRSDDLFNEEVLNISTLIKKMEAKLK